MLVEGRVVDGDKNTLCLDGGGGCLWLELAKRCPRREAELASTTLFAGGGYFAKFGGDFDESRSLVFSRRG